MTVAKATVLQPGTGLWRDLFHAEEARRGQSHFRKLHCENRDSPCERLLARPRRGDGTPSGWRTALFGRTPWRPMPAALRSSPRRPFSSLPFPP